MPLNPSRPGQLICSASHLTSPRPHRLLSYSSLCTLFFNKSSPFPTRTFSKYPACLPTCSTHRDAQPQLLLARNIHSPRQSDSVRDFHRRFGDELCCIDDDLHTFSSILSQLISDEHRQPLVALTLDVVHLTTVHLFFPRLSNISLHARLEPRHPLCISRAHEYLLGHLRGSSTI